ncbi:unnamed protein product [Ambrosiozyma monospora]|uniref:Unnamed protein product n=1 Tax=Ambrosiozyma monospora TaxID=43982 RepID=A0ACB5T935_AMBMO|nr:unnamed protein product [Ambrosiozyma monospora]
MLDPSERLRNAIVDDKPLIVSRLLKRFPQFLDNIDPKNGWSNLHYAAFHDRYDIAELLLQHIHRRYLNRDNYDCFASPLHSKRNSESFRRAGYTQINSEEEIKMTFKKETVIHLASRTNSYRTLQLLLSYFNICIDQRAGNGYTATHICSRYDYQESLSVLLENGAYPNIQDDDGNTPLHLSLQYGFIKCAEMLMNYKANDEMVNNEGWKPIDIAFNFEVQTKFQAIKSRPHAVSMHPSTSNSTVNSSYSIGKVGQSSLNKVALPPIHSRKFSLSSFSDQFDDDDDQIGFDYDSDLHSLGTSSSSKNTRSSSPLIGAQFAPGLRSASTQNLPISQIDENKRSQRRRPPSVSISIPTNTPQMIAASAVTTPTSTTTPRKPPSVMSPNSKRISMSTRTFRSNSQSSEPSPQKSPNRAGTNNSIIGPSSSQPSPRKSRSASTLSSQASVNSQTFTSIRKPPLGQPHNHMQQQSQHQSQQQQQQYLMSLPKPQHINSVPSNFPQPPTIRSHSRVGSGASVKIKRAFSSSSDIDEAASKLNDFKMKNDNRIALGIKLDTLVNKSQDSLVLESPVDKPNNSFAHSSGMFHTASFSKPNTAAIAAAEAFGLPSPLSATNTHFFGNSTSKVLSIPIASLKSRRAS